jgi:hypothetical protein
MDKPDLDKMTEAEQIAWMRKHYVESVSSTRPAETMEEAHQRLDDVLQKASEMARAAGLHCFFMVASLPDDQGLRTKGILGGCRSCGGYAIHVGVLKVVSTEPEVERTYTNSAMSKINEALEQSLVDHMAKQPGTGHA